MGNNFAIELLVDRDIRPSLHQMVGEEQKNHVHQESLPIPTYEEAISSHSSSSQSFLGSIEISHDAQRQGLLDPLRPRQKYEPPSVEPVEPIRSSLDTPSSSRQSSARSSTEGLHREMMEMEILDPNLEGHSRGLRRIQFSKHINNLTHSFSIINLHFRQWLPSSDYLLSRTPSFPDQLRPNWIIVGRVFALLLVLISAYFVFFSDLFSVERRRGTNQVYDVESVRKFAQGHVNESYIRENSEHITSFDHAAGTEGGLYLAKWVEGLFHAAGLEYVGLERFDVYLNFPRQGGRRVAIVDPPDLAWEAIIEEEPTYKIPSRKQTLVFHGHSASGNITGPLVYANAGSREDFKNLKEKGIDLRGTIVLITQHNREGSGALQVKAAEMAGAAGCILFSDPATINFQKFGASRDGRSSPIDEVRRDSVSLMNWVVGDVLSRGYASHPSERKRDKKDVNPGLNKIPSIPLAWRDIRKLFRALKGQGERLTDTWNTGAEKIELWTGNQSSPIVHLMNQQDDIERQPIYNVIGKITGIEQPEKSIIVGNHRDAWCFGAADPGSGTAILLEVIRIFGKLRELGWRPLRTIEFASWDGGEYNLIGSTEHVEARIDEIRQNGIAYINVNVGVGGSEFKAAASPVFESALLRVLDHIIDPNSNKSLRSIWDEKKTTLQKLGIESDYVAFQDMAGTSSIDLGFGGSPYPSHSCYDNFSWMKKYGDPDFQYHKALAQIWVLLILELADTEMLPFDFNAYSRTLRQHVRDLERYADAKGALRNNLDLQPLHQASETFIKDSKIFHAFETSWAEIFRSQGGFESNVMAIKRMSHNTRMANFETNLLDVHGVRSIPFIFFSFFFLQLLGIRSPKSR